ncbi:MAG: three-Cys-motif partner protein TcmP [Patescibacteria group bacterium]
MEISLHSNKKHLALGYYLSIIRNLIMSPKTPFRKLYYADLYCGDGKCEIKRVAEKYEPPIINSILKPAKEGKFSVRCFLNDLEKIEQMKENTQDYKEFIKCYSCEDANVCYEKFLKFMPPDKFCIFFLDPTNHNDLKWKTIKKISEHSHTYYGNKVRRPELIINLMTYTMSGSYMAKSFKSIDEALGTNKWFELINKYKEEGMKTPVERAFLDTLIKQLEKLGYRVPSPIKILNTFPHNTVYYLVWATNEQGYDIIEKKVIPYMKKKIGEIHKENKKKLVIAKAREKGEGNLDKWC